MHNSQSQLWHQQEETPDGGGHGSQDQPQEGLSPFASELWMVVNPPRTLATLDLAGQEATQIVPLLSAEDSGSRKRKEPVVQWKECSTFNPVSKENRTGVVANFTSDDGTSSWGGSLSSMFANTLTAPLDSSSSVQPGGQVGNFGFNHGRSGGGASVYPMVTTTLTAPFDGSSSMQHRGQVGNFGFNHGTIAAGTSVYPMVTDTPIASFHRSSSMQPGDQDGNFEFNHGISGGRSSVNTPTVPLHGSSSILQQNLVSKFGVNDGTRGDESSMVANIPPTLLDDSNSSMQPGTLIGNFGINDDEATRDGSSLLTKVSNIQTTPLRGSSAVQPGRYPAGNIAVNDGASGSTGISLHPMVTNNQTTALIGFSDAHTRAPIPNFSAAQRPLEGHHNLIFPTVASAPISRNAISDVGIQSAGSCSISPAQCTRAPKRPTKVGKGIKGIKNFFAAIGMNVPAGSTPRSTAPVAGTVRSDHEIGGSSRNQGYTGVLQMNTATRNDNIADSKSSNWNRHDAMPHSAAASGGNNWSSTTFTMQQTTIPHKTAVLNDHEGGSSSNPNSAMFAMQQVAIPHNSTARNDHEDGSGNWNLNNFASQLNAAPYNTAGYSSTHNDRQEGGTSCNLSSANIATQLNAYPLNAAFGYSNIRNNNKIGASSSNNSSTYMSTQHTAVPQNTAMHSTHEQDGTQTNWSSTTNEMELDAIPHTTVGGYPEMHNGHQNDAGNSYMNLINIETALDIEAFAETTCWNGEIGDSDSVWDWDPADILLPNDFNMNSEQQMANPVDPYQTTYADQDNTGIARRSS